MLVFVILWLILTLYVAVLARQRGRHFFGWLVFALLASPLMAGVVLLMKPDLAEKDFVESVTQDMEVTHVKCPHCAEYVRPEASKCKYCQNKLTPQPGLGERRLQERLDEGLEDIKATQSNTIIIASLVFGAAALVWLFWVLF